jgi:HSP20 family molecular chaperone IbpA
MRLGRFKTEIGRTDKEVTLTISLPGLAGGAADVNIKEGRIKLSFQARSASGQKSAGSLIKRESPESYVKIMPVPEDAVPGTGKVQIDGELVKIKFERRTN